MTKFLGSLVALMMAFGGAGSVTASPADPGDAEQVVRGAAIYASACASCHGARLEGAADWQNTNADGTYPPPPHNVEGHTWHHSDRLLHRYIKLGGQEAFKDLAGFKSAMPGFGEGLSDRAIWDVIAFIKSNWTEEARAYQRAVSENGN